MSIQKLDFDYVKQSQKSFTTFLNDVVQNICDPITLAVYCYLSTLPPQWTVNKAHLMKHFGVGRDKIGTVLKRLHDNYLLSYERERNKDGTLGKSAIIILDGQKFIEKVVNKQKHATTLPESSNVDSTTLLKIQSLDKPEYGETAPIYKISIINKIKKQRGKKNKKNPTSLSDNFLPNKQNQKLLQETSERALLTEKVLLAKFRSVTKSNDKISYDWQAELESFLLREKSSADPGFNNKRIDPGFNNKHKVSNEVRSTVPFYGPGHPTWESLHGKRD